MSELYQKEINNIINMDIAVFGAGPAGIAAAVMASRQGKKVLLVEKSGCLGGMGTSGLVPAFMAAGDGNKILCEGFGYEVIEKILKGHKNREELLRGLREHIPIDPEKLKVIYDDLVKDANVYVKLFTQAIDVITEDKVVTGVIIAENEQLSMVHAKQYIDTTGDATLSYFAGVKCVIGDESGDTMPPTLCFVLSGIDYDKYSLITKRMKEFIEKAISDQVFTNPDRHVSGPFRWGENVVGMNCGHMFDSDCLTSDGLTKAITWGRKIAREFTTFYNEYVPGFENAELCATATVVGVRETRRIIGEYVLTIEDYKQRKSFEDEIGRCNYSVDIHKNSGSEDSFAQLLKEMRKTYHIGDFESYGIPLRSLIPKGFTNLLVAGRCISTDRLVQGSIRIMPTCFITGQAAGLESSKRVK